MKFPAALLLLICCSLAPVGFAADDTSLFSRDNLTAWCIVPFDAKKRGPEERAVMLEKLGIKKFAYDYRTEHVPTFDAEMDALKRHHIELTAWWFPGTLNDEAKKILDVLQRHNLKIQLWITGGGATPKDDAEQKARVEAEAKRVRTISDAAAKIGCTVALYNHGGWFGEPENQLAIIERLRADGVTNVGIVYNQHHGHGDLDRFPALLEKMKPHLVALNLNGMTRDGEKTGKMIMPLGQGDLDLQLLKTIRDSGWHGPIGILNHTNEDAQARLQDNLDGLAWLVAQLDGKPAGPKPTPRSWHDPSALKPTAQTYLEDPSERAKLPEFKIIPAAKTEELTPANGWPSDEDFHKWNRSLGGPTSNRFSMLDQINRANVKSLQVAWTYHSGDGKANIQCNPIIVDGVMFAPTAGRHIVALDAATGKEIWNFDTKSNGKRLEDIPARRGLVFWPGDGDAGARVIFGAGNWIYALDSKSGKPLASFGDGGRVEIPMGATACGAVWKHVFVVPGYNGDVFGYDVVTGKSLWRFHTIPLPGEFGADTWEAHEVGANCWGGMALDESRGIAYIGTGSPKPNFIGTGHRGENLFGNCVIAIDCATGKRLWHFQEIRHDIWDLDVPAPPNLVTVTRDGKKYDAVANVTKIGNTLLLDRVTGKPLFPVRLRRAPVSKLPGEWTAPYQPDIELPEPFAKQNFSRDDITDRTSEARDAIEKQLTRANMGWFEAFEEAKPTAFYGLHGGAEWTGAAFDPRTSRLYVTANKLPWTITVMRDDDAPPAKPPTAGEQLYQQMCAPCHAPDRVGIGTAPPLRGIRHRMTDAQVLELWKTGRNLMPVAPPMTPEQQKQLLDFLFVRDRPQPPTDPNAPPKYSFSGYRRLMDAEEFPGCKPPWGTLNCIDLNTGKIVFRVPLGEYDELKKAGVPKTGQENFGGAMVTAGGLVFASGTRDEKIRAFDSQTGEELWSAKLPLHGTAPPATYEVNGKQFVVIAASGGGKLGGEMGDSWVAFALPDSARAAR